MIRLFFVLLLFLPARLLAEPPRVVASIAPIHGITSDIMQGVAEPVLLVKPGNSPHEYALKPSNARQLATADLIIWIGPRLETFLVKSLRSLAADARKLELLALEGLHLLEFRDHESHGSDESSHQEESHEEHGHEEHGHEDDGDEHDVHGPGQDPHVWLSVENAIVIAEGIAGALAQTDPANEMKYRENAKLVVARYRALARRMEKILEPVREQPFIVYHDAYGYLEQGFDLNILASVVQNEHLRPGANRISELRREIVSRNIRCVFGEPQFNTRLLKPIVEGSHAGIGVLDPIGVEVQTGAGQYERLMEQLATSLSTCLQSG